MTDSAQRGIYDASLNAFPSVRHCVYAGNVRRNHVGLHFSTHNATRLK
jgi:hypothetical protein